MGRLDLFGPCGPRDQRPSRRKNRGAVVCVNMEKMKKDLLSKSETFFFATSKTPFSMSQEKKGSKIKSQRAASGFQVYASQLMSQVPAKMDGLPGGGAMGAPGKSLCSPKESLLSTDLLPFISASGERK